MTDRGFAACPKGIEYLLVDELTALGAMETRATRAGVHFTGAPGFVYRACLWSRLASRILLPLAEFDAVDADALYAGVQDIDWRAHLDADGTFAVDAHGTNAALKHTKFIAQRVKDAVVDQFRAHGRGRPQVDLVAPSIRLDVHLGRDRATLSLDLCGSPLFLRGWRRGQGDAPLKENLAAAMLARARWPEIHAARGAFIDPMCGSGTLLIEAALIAADVAPGLARRRWGFFGWRGHDADAWNAQLAEARARAVAGLAKLEPKFFGYDVDPQVLVHARHNAQEAGVAGFIRLAARPVSALAPVGAGAPGLIMTNPPYGERLSAGDDLVATYRAFGAAARRACPGWHAAWITPDARLARATGLEANRKYKLMNGALDCTLYVVDVVPAADAPRPSPKPLSAGAQQLANRIAKNRERLKRWLKREGVSCWRVYDADLPEYAAAIDVYDGHLHIQEYAAPKTIPEETARRRLREIVRVAGEAFDVPRERIAIKVRRPQARDDRYGRVAARGEFLVVDEGGLKFEVNLHDYLDTGLFLDHRPVRARLRGLAAGKRFLNLFCYTATASVHAAAGGALTTTSVDLSATYLEWAARNFALNAYTGPAHRLVQADVMAWLAAERGEYDLIFIDPPTFSNSKRADDFDVQRDHVRLIELATARLAPGGLIVFSNNFRRFQLDANALSAFEVRDITRATIPPDFARDPRIHHCFELRPRTR